MFELWQWLKIFKTDSRNRFGRTVNSTSALIPLFHFWFVQLGWKNLLSDAHEFIHLSTLAWCVTVRTKKLPVFSKTGQASRSNDQKGWKFSTGWGMILASSIRTWIRTRRWSTSLPFGSSECACMYACSVRVWVHACVRECEKGWIGGTTPTHISDVFTLSGYWRLEEHVVCPAAFNVRCRIVLLECRSESTGQSEVPMQHRSDLPMHARV